MIERIKITDAAIEVIDQLKQQTPSLIFHQSGGCCDGSSPMCFPKDELMLNDNDVWLGRVHGCDFYMSEDQFQYWRHTQLTLDIVKGRGASFSLEIPLGVRFMIRSKLFSDEDLTMLTPIKKGSEIMD
ncbi:MAG: UDP-glucose 4-epimerase [Cytophagales bacterium CG12_big_fil_rev_8_21_14_0_65_40_12]|nr:MAG: UDP-glucose 4-epimerase [Cytophagales bacterium CG12_big_fil_rev_8_21_14_0_65_40_12]